MTDDLREKIMGLIHLQGCQSYSRGYNDKTAGKELDTDWIEAHEEEWADEFMKLIEGRHEVGQDELYLLVHEDDGTPAMGGGSSSKQQLRVYLDFKEAMRGIKRIRNDDNRKIVIRKYVR